MLWSQAQPSAEIVVLRRLRRGASAFAGEQNFYDKSRGRKHAYSGIVRWSKPLRGFAFACAKSASSSLRRCDGGDARLHRKTLRYSKSLDMLKYSIRLLLYYLKFKTVAVSTYIITYSATP